MPNPLIFAVCVLLLILLGCARVPEEASDLDGEIISVGRSVDSEAVQILVEAHPGQSDGLDMAYVFILDDRAVFLRENDADRGAAVADLEEGQRVKVWFDGPVAESYPVQGTARAVLIVSDP